MKRLTNLTFVLTLVAIVEAIYALIAVLTPPDMVESLTGWVFSADGQWITKLLGVALASQAWVAWTIRKKPHIGVAWGLAFYQFASATVDWVMWLLLADQGIFSNTTAQIGVLLAVPSHYLLGILMVIAIRTYNRQAQAH